MYTNPVFSCRVTYYVEQVLTSILKFPTTDQITEAFKISMIFLLLALHRKYTCQKVEQLTDGQLIWSRTDVMTFSNFHYSNSSSIKCLQLYSILTALTTSYCTMERRGGYNSKISIITRELCQKPTRVSSSQNNCLYSNFLITKQCNYV